MAPAGGRPLLTPGLALACAALALAACAHTPPTPDSQEVDDFELEGTKQLEEDAVKERIATTESSWLPAWVPVFGRVGWYDPTTWQADLRRIARYYEANGFYQARILEEQVTPVKEGHVKLLVKLREGEPARVTSLELKGLEGLEARDRNSLLARVPLDVGDIFLEDAWALTKAIIASQLRELGYAEAVVEGEVVVDADAARVDVKIEAVPGTRYRFGKTFVATDANAQVPARLVADVATPDVTPGDWFSESALAEAQTRVFQMGVFGAVKVNRGAPDREEGTVPIVIDVREAPFRSVRLGFGLGGDLIRQEVRVVGEYTNRNLGLARLFTQRALLDRLTVKGKFGWAFVPSILAVATRDPTAKTGPVFRVLTEYEVPRVFSLRTLSFQSSLDLSRALDNAFDYWGGELKLGFVWRPRTDVTVFPSVNLDAFFLNSQISLGTTAPTAAIGCPLLPSPCLVSFLDVTAELDRRDNRLEPRSGHYLAVSVQGGLSQTNQVTPYFRVVPEARGYVSFGEEKTWTLAGRLRLGELLAPGNNTPIVARFFSGGANMRGFSQRRLSPMVAVPTKGSDGTLNYDAGQALPIGGSGLAEASLELRWNVWDALVLAVFSDAGLVTLQPLGSGTDFASYLYAAVGLGARYRTPLGPVRLDLAFRLPFVGGPQRVFQQDARDVTVPTNGGCFFGLGYDGNPAYAGSPENLCSFHLSIGEAF